MDKTDVGKRCSKYYRDLYNHKLRHDSNILGISNNNRELGDILILQEEVKETVCMFKDRKSPGVDNMSSKLLKHGEPNIVKARAVTCEKILEMKCWPKEWTYSLRIPISKKSNLRLC
uniref:Reverse transcriptase domain-containing protein n=1 Tax=Octopus bimaculoides TaxID=37653 RepID=A0A0L8GNX9_OCTBM|eukprot:XP_014779341.1 PREDICTED: uncharacterized protein LOC106875626 [Octopus bimaculoides]